VTVSPTFSVVMAAYNAAATIDAAIRSVLAQTRDDWELVVVDDGSTDDTASRVATYASSGRVRLVGQPNLGLGAARNAGIREARGEVVCVLDSDDLWLPHYLAAMADALEREPEAAMAYTDAWVLEDATGRILKESAMATGRPPLPPPDEPLAFFLELLERNFVYVSAAIRRSVLDRVGLYETSPVGCEDYELSLRIAAAGHRIVHVPGRLAVYRLRSDSMSSDTRAMERGRREVYRLVARYELPSSAREAVANRLAAVTRDALAPARSAPALGAARRGLALVSARLLWRRYALAEPPRDVTALLTAVEAPPPD
jgi:glycosyltransferase involved in cell wall biosynthesis